MIILNGKYGEATVFTDNIDDVTVSQIINMLNHNFIAQGDIKIMPDTHAGKGSVIGFTSKLRDKVVPNIIGVDIGCGMLTVKLNKELVDFDDETFESLDDAIRNKKILPYGFDVNGKAKSTIEELKIKDLTIYNELENIERLVLAAGSLGSGNHFVEIAEGESGDIYLIIHSGSRNLGHQVAKNHQQKAIEYIKTKRIELNAEKDLVIAKMREEGKTSEIAKYIKHFGAKIDETLPTQEDLAYLEGDLKDNYINDMKICQEFANKNREIMAEAILKHLYGCSVELADLESFQTIHNYINFEDNIVRKGAISAKKDEIVLIPINMRDGSILARGKGSPDWNYSAPHGAGRILSRGQAKDILQLEDFEKTMDGIFTKSVKQSTLDESPFAYKNMNEIIENTEDTIEIIEILKPIYNFKA